MSVILTFVASEGPWFVMIIVKFTKSPTLAFATLAFLTRVMLTAGSTVTVVSLEVLFSLSVEFPTATFV